MFFTDFYIDFVMTTKTQNVYFVNKEKFCCIFCWLSFHTLTNNICKSPALFLRSGQTVTWRSRWDAGVRGGLVRSIHYSDGGIWLAAAWACVCTPVAFCLSVSLLNTVVLRVSPLGQESYGSGKVLYFIIIRYLCAGVCWNQTDLRSAQGCACVFSYMSGRWTCCVTSQSKKQRHFNYLSALELKYLL